MKPIRICKYCSLKATTIEDLSKFVKNKKSKYGCANLCVECKTNTRKEYIPTNEQREKYKKAQRERYKNLSEEEKQVLFEKMRERYYKNHKKYRDQKNKKARENREYYAEKCRKRRFNISNTTDNSVTLETLDILKEQQDYKCFYCSTKLDFSIKQSVHLDHIEPLCKGGKHTISNVLWSCASCNLKRGGKII